ncbi:MAG: hypothetical protein WD929_05870 [Steroidobacteraceae bacterium]
MSEKLSRNLMTAELVLCVLPLSVLWLLSLSLLSEVIDSTIWQICAGLMAAVLLTAPQVALARLAFTFAARGSRQLRAIPDYWWVVATMGGGIALCSIAAQVVILATGNYIQEIVASCIKCAPVPGDDFGLKLIVGNAIDIASRVVWFAPLLIPLVHLWLERNRAHAL